MRMLQGIINRALYKTWFDHKYVCFWLNLGRCPNCWVKLRPVERKILSKSEFQDSILAKAYSYSRYRVLSESRGKTYDVCDKCGFECR